MPYQVSLKAKRNRLEWQDAPRTPEQRTAYAIAAKHQPAMTRALRRYFAEVRSPEAMREFERGLLQATTPEQAIDALPLAAAGARLSAELKRVLANITEETGRAAGRRGIEVPEPVIKARIKYSFTLDNPFSLRRIADEVFRLVTGINESLRESIRGAVQTGFAQGQGAKAIAQDILEGNLGLTQRDVSAVARTRRAAFDAAREAGFTTREATKQARVVASEHHAKLLDRRAMNIARTETIRAEANGLTDSWRQAQDAGVMPPQTRKVWIASVPRVNERLCKICEALGNTYGPDSPTKGVAMGEQFHAINGKSYDSPPVHPQCRCTLGLVTTLPT